MRELPRADRGKLAGERGKLWKVKSIIIAMTIAAHGTMIPKTEDRKR